MGWKKNQVDLRKLTSLCQKVTKNKIKIKRIKKTSIYDIPYFVSKNAKAKRLLSWKPRTNIKDIISKTYNWINGNKKLIKRYYNE